jgi:hypothetical protein
MSTQVTDLLSAADAMAAHLQSLPELAGVTVIVNRQKDLETEINQAVANASGAALLVEPVSGQPSDRSSKTLVFDNRYMLSLWSLPLLRADDAYTASQRTVAIMAAMHHWQPAPTKQALKRFEVTAWQIQPDEQYLIYTILGDLTEVYAANSN